MTFLELVGIDLATFNEQYRGRKPFIGAVPAAMVETLLDWQGVNYLIDHSEPYLDQISLVRDDYRLDRRRFLDECNVTGRRTLSAAAVARALEEGHSLLLNKLCTHYPPVRALSEGLTSALEEQVSINGYVAWRARSAFATHWDDHDVLVIQTAGQKEWAIHEPRRDHPLRHDTQYDTDASNLKPFWKGVLETGSILYLPRGWWHSVCATGEGSIHLTVGFTGRTTLDFVSFIRDLACEDAAFRQDLPRPEHTTAASAAAAVDRIVDLIRSSDPEDLLARFWCRHLSLLPMKRRSQLPQSIEFEDSSATLLEFKLARIARPVIAPLPDGGAALEMGGKRWEFDSRVRPTLDLMADGGWRTYHDIRDHLGHEPENELPSLLAALCREGVLLGREPIRHANPIQ